MSTTRIARRIRAPRAAVYRALLDPQAVTRWRVPFGMTARVHEFDARPGGAFRVSLTYDAPGATGKTTAHTDTYHGRFTELVPDERVVEVLEFETDDAALRGRTTITTTLHDAEGGATDLLGVHEGLPPGVRPQDNETGWRQALERLAWLLESGCVVRPARPDDAEAWLTLRQALWPEATHDEHRTEVARFFAGAAREPAAVLLAEASEGRIAGFAELSIRPYAEGCRSDRVAFVEGWFVAADARGRGIGAALIGAAEAWARSQGCTELASDAEADNELSAAAHRALGFTEVGLIRCFRKDVV